MKKIISGRLLTRNLLQELDLESRGFQIEPEVTAKILRRKIDIVEVPISYKGRNYHKGKKIKARDGSLSHYLDKISV
jgi:hypothetical protein